MGHSERRQYVAGQALSQNHDALATGPDPNIHSVDAFSRAYGGRDWRAYRWLVAVCVEHGEPGPILDIGAGTGLFVEACQRYGLSCVGLEGSADAVETARRRYPADIRQHFLSRALPFEDAMFSVAVCNQTIEHLTPEIARHVLCECLRVLRPQGLVAIYSPCRHDPVQAGEPTHINLYTPTRLREEVLAAGFTGYRAMDVARPVFGGGRLMRALASSVFRASQWDVLSESANCLAHKP